MYRPATRVVALMRQGYTAYADSMIALDANLSLLGSFQPVHPACQDAQCDWGFGATPIVCQPPGCPTMVVALSKDRHLPLAPLWKILTR